MSYDIKLLGKACESCGKGGEDWYVIDPTYNLTAIFDAALTGEDLPNPDVSEFQTVILREPTSRPRGLRLLNECRAEDTVEWLRKALGRLEDPEKQEAFKKLEPPNGWGTLPGAVEVVKELIAAALECPDRVWDIC